MKRRRPTSRPHSAARRTQARAAMADINARRHLRPKCGAARKLDGEACQQPALSNGRCRFHGGRTPKGDAWHRPRWPERDGPAADAKLARKLKDRERAAKRRAKRLAAMSPEERERHEAWQRAHKPGVNREALRVRRDQDEAVRGIFDRPRAKPSPELQALTAELERARRRQSELDLQAAIANGEGVFG